MFDTIIFLAVVLAFLESLWLSTNLFIDLSGWALKPANIFYVKDYLNSSRLIEYPLWLYTARKTSISKLLSCPLCLGFWMNVFYWLIIRNRFHIFSFEFFDVFLCL